MLVFDLLLIQDFVLIPYGQKAGLLQGRNKLANISELIESFFLWNFYIGVSNQTRLQFLNAWSKAISMGNFALVWAKNSLLNFNRATFIFLPGEIKSFFHSQEYVFPVFFILTWHFNGLSLLSIKPRRPHFEACDPRGKTFKSQLSNNLGQRISG
jgi:hypothetical protein